METLVSQKRKNIYSWEQPIPQLQRIDASFFIEMSQFNPNRISPSLTDAEIVAEQTNTSLDYATEVLARHQGDIVNSIMEITTS